MPEFARVCEEVESGSIGFAEAPKRLAVGCDLLAHYCLVQLKVANALLISCDDGIAGGIDDPVEKRFHFPFDNLDLLGKRRALRPPARQLRVPQIAKHPKGEIEQPFGGPEAFKKGLEFPLDLFLPDGFARFRASPRVAQIIAVSSAAPFRPTGRQGLSAMVASDESSQGEIGADVLTRRNSRHAIAAILHCTPRGQAHQRFMLAGDQVQTPFRVTDMPRINRPVEHLDHTLEMHFVIAVAGIGGLGFQEALHLAHRCKAARCKAVKSLGNDRGQRLIAHQQLAVARHSFKPIADRRAGYPIAAHGAGTHAVLSLLGILPALVLRDRRKDVLLQLAIGVITELDCGRF